MLTSCVLSQLVKSRSRPLSSSSNERARLSLASLAAIVSLLAIAVYCLKEVRLVRNESGDAVLRPCANSKAEGGDSSVLFDVEAV